MAPTATAFKTWSPATGFAAARRAQFERKVGKAIEQVQHLRDYKRCLGTDTFGNPLVTDKHFERFMNLTNQKHVEMAQKFHERTVEGRNLDHPTRENPYSHVITAMLLLRPDITAIAHEHAKGLFASVASEGYNVAPFLSFNDFSFVYSLYQAWLPKVLGENKFRVLMSAMQTSFGPGEGIYPDGLPFCEAQTDRAAKIIHSFLVDRRSDLAGTGKQAELEEIDKLIAMLKVRRGTGLEYEFAPKDLSFLTLGDKMGDCMSFNPHNQLKHDGAYEKGSNMFPAAPLYLASANFQTLVAYYDNTPIVKFRFFIGRMWQRWMLVFDEATIAPQLRGIGPNQSQTLVNMKENIYFEGLQVMADIAKKMGNIPYVTDVGDGVCRPSWLKERTKTYAHKSLASADTDWDATNEPLRTFILANAPEDPAYVGCKKMNASAFSMHDYFEGNFMVRLDRKSFPDLVVTQPF